MDKLEEKHLDTKRGFRYRYYISPSAQADSTKPAILLCHGWPDSAHLWKYIVPHLLTTKLRIIVPDLLGYGGTSKPTDPKHFEIKAMVNDVLEIVDAENITSPIIPMGHDWGSFFAQRFYLLNPSRMAGLINLNVALMLPSPEPFDLDAMNAMTEKHIGYPVYAYWELFTDPAGPPLMEQHLESVWYALHGDSDDWMKQLFCSRGALKDWVSNDRKDVQLRSYALDDDLKNAWIDSMRQGGFSSPCCWYRAMKDNHNHDTEKYLNPTVENPYLFIGADGDAVCRTDAIEMPKQAGVISDLEVKELHSGHWTPFERPNEIGDIVLDWLARKGFSTK